MLLQLVLNHADTVLRRAVRFGYRMLSPRRLLAALLAFLLVFTPLSPLMLIPPVAPIAQAKADAIDDLDSCLGILGAGSTAAMSVATAVANPDFVLCSSEAAAGDPATIAFMAVMTALWTADYAATGSMPFTDPASCQQLLQHDLLKMIVSGLEGMMTGLFKEMMQSLIGDKGMCLMEEIAGAQLDAGCGDQGVTAPPVVTPSSGPVAGDPNSPSGVAQPGSDAANNQIQNEANQAAGAANQAIQDAKNQAAAVAQQALDDATQKLQDAANQQISDAESQIWDLFSAAGGPVGITHLLSCGCDAAGTVAIITTAAVTVAGDAKACVNTLGNVGALLGELFTDPGKVISHVAKDLCDATGVCQLAGAIADGLEDVWSFLGGGRHGDPCPPGGCIDTGFTPPNCTDSSLTAANYPGGDINYDATCICQPPQGRVEPLNSNGQPVLNSNGDRQSACETCDPYSGRDPNGFCRRCPVGFKQSADGTCGQFFTCTPPERYGPDGPCFGCSGLFEQVDPKGDGCWPICKPPNTVLDDVNRVNDPQSGACVCKSGMVDLNDGKGCVDVIFCGADTGTVRDPATNTCVSDCPGQQVNLSNGAGSGTYSCKLCPDGQHKEGAACLKDFVPIVCTGTNEIRTGSNTCFTCPDGTVPGFNGCQSPCAPGSQPRQKPTTADFVTSSLKYGTSGIVSFGDLAQKTAAQIAGFGSGGSGTGASPGTPGFTKADRDTYDAAHPAKGADQCVRCGANEYSKTTTITFPANGTGAGGYSISTSVCHPCEAGQVSNPGSGICHFPFVAEVVPGPTVVRLTPGMKSDTDKLSYSVPTGTPLPVKPRFCPNGEVAAPDGSCPAPSTGKELQLPSGGVVILKPVDNPSTVIMKSEVDPSTVILKRQGDPTTVIMKPVGDPTAVILKPQGNPTTVILKPDGDPTTVIVKPEGQPTAVIVKPEGSPTAVILVPRKSTATIDVPRQDLVPPKYTTTILVPRQNSSTTPPKYTTTIMVPRQNTPTAAVMAPHQPTVAVTAPAIAPRIIMPMPSPSAPRPKP